MPKMPGGDDGEKKEESAESREEAKEQVAFNIINDMITISTIINNIDIINIIIIMSMTMVGMMMMMTMNRKDFDSRRSRTRRRRELSFTQNRKLSYFTIRWMTNEAMTEIMMEIVKLMRNDDLLPHQITSSRRKERQRRLEHQSEKRFHPHHKSNFFSISTNWINFLIFFSLSTNWIRHRSPLTKTSRAARTMRTALEVA